MTTACKTEHDRAREAADVWTVLGLFVCGQTVTGEQCDTRLSWSVEYIAKTTKIGPVRAAAAVNRLVKWGCLACCAFDTFKLTEDGLGAYFGNIYCPVYFSVIEWTREALTGMDRHGRQSTIQRAVVSTKEVRTPTPVDPVVDPLARHRVAKEIAAVLGITYAEAVEGMARNAFIQCPGFGEQGPHMARENSRHMLCAKCDRRRRRDND